MNTRGQAPIELPTVACDWSAQPDSALLAQFSATRAPEAFAEMVRRHRAMVYRVCTRVLNQAQDAEDAAQAVFVILFRRPNLVNRSLAGWLHKVSRDVATDLLRARISRARREEEVARMKTAGQQASDEHLREELDAALGRLPAPLQEAVVLRYLEGCSQEEAARLAGCPQGTLGRRAMEGVNQLRALLARRGVLVASSVLVAFMARESASTAPLTLGAVAAGAAIETGRAAVLAQAQISGLFWAKVKIAAAVIAAVTTTAAVVHTLTPSAPTTYVERHVLVGHDSGVQALAFAPGGGTLASASSDGTVRVWDMAAGTQRSNWPGANRNATAIAYSPDGLTVASGWVDGTIVLHDSSTGAVRRSWRGHAEEITSLCFARDGRSLASASWDKTVVLWNPTDGSRERTFRGHSSGVAAVRFSPDDRNLANASNDRTVCVWTRSSGAVVHKFTGHTDVVHALAYAPDGQTLASGAQDGAVIVWDAITGQEKQRWQVPSGQVTTLAYAPDGRVLVSGSVEGTVAIWDPTTAKRLARLQGHVNGVVAAVFSKDGQTLATGSWDRSIRIWSAVENRPSTTSAPSTKAAR